MGSAPWKQQRITKWEDDFAGKRVVVADPGTIYLRDGKPANRRDLLNGSRLHGLFVGHGTAKGQVVIYVHLRPEMNVRDAGYFDHEVAIVVKRGMTVELDEG